jgi:hypothetical protein
MVRWRRANHQRLIDLDDRDGIWSLEKNAYLAPSVLRMTYPDAVVINLSFPSALHIDHCSPSDKDGTKAKVVCITVVLSIFSFSYFLVPLAHGSQGRDVARVPDTRRGTPTS